VKSNNLTSAGFDKSHQTSAPETTSSTFTFSNPTSITIPSVGAATPYPSNIVVSGVPSTIEKVTITITGFTHQFLGDVDILLVDPSGKTMMMMGNAGGSFDAANATVTFDDAAPTGIVLANLASGSYKPTTGVNFLPNLPAPAPTGPYQMPAQTGTATLTSVFGGGNPNGTWSLYVNDRLNGFAGSISGGWSVTIVNSITAQNTQAISIPDSGPAGLYPSSLNVAGLIGAVTGTTVFIHDFSHVAPDDVDLLLVAPGGRSVVLMSDVGDSIPVADLDLTIDSNASASFPDKGPLVAGTFKPTNFGAGDPFPAPAPGGPPTGDTLSVFNGINPNGTWSLYLVDDNGTSTGSISGGWSIALSTSATACSLGLSSNVQVFPITGGSGSFDIDSPFGCDWSAIAIHNWITITSPTSGAGGLATLTFDVAPNMLAGRSGIIRVSNATQSRDFNVQQPSGCPFSLSETTQQFSGMGGTGSVGVTAAGVCGWFATPSHNWITINSGTGTGDGTVNYTVAPNTASVSRTGSVSIGARTLTVNQAAGSGRTTHFDFDADDKADLAVFRTTNNVWYVYNSSDGTVSAQQFGLAGDKLPTADYDGDGRSDIAVFRQGTWYILESLTSVMRTVQWGVESDSVAPADYDGDGKADIAVWRESNGTWYVQKSSNGLNHIEHFGTTGDYPVARDYDGDGKADLAVYRPGSSTWFIQRSSDGTLRSEIFGQLGDKLVPADYDGDGMTDIAVWRVNTSTWYLLQSSFGFVSVGFGESTDQVVPADYDGDGKADIAVMRNGNWFIYQSSNGVVRLEQFGANTDVALQFALIPN
jgi:subtilisin-like proprotein convertase family protein